MAKFVIKASEFKNVCKAVNDRKLAELKKEIIEILKKQEEREVKKAVEFFEAQEAHYTHLEKSTLSGKWVEKAGYGIGTVRVWKGKKYKKIAPGKWARVFEKEGRGTNVAIGRLISKVSQIDNAEDLMAFVQANKQRFVDENGVDLPVLDKLRAAVDSKNSGTLETKDSTRKDLDNGVYKTKEELEKMSIDELDKYKDAVYNKYKKIDLSSKKIIPARVAYKEAYDTWREKVRASKDMMYTFETKLMNRLQDGIESQKKACEEWDIKEWSDNKLETYIEEAEKWKDKGLVHLADPIIKKFKESGKDMFDNNDFVGPSMNYQGFAVAHSKAYDNMKKELEARKKAKEEEIKPEKPVKETESKDTFEDEMNRLNDAQEAAWEGFESGSEIKATPENSKKFYDKVKKFVDENNIKLTKKHHDEIAENNGHSFNEALALAGAYGEEEKKKALEWNKETNKKYKGAALDLSQIDEFKESEESDGVKYERELVEAWKDDFKGLSPDLLKENLKKYTRVLENVKAESPSDEQRIGVKQNEHRVKAIKELLEESESEKHQNRSDAMKGNKNAYKGGLAKETVKFVKDVKGEPFEEYNTDKDKFALYYDRDSGKETGLVISQEIADIIDSHNEPSILDWKDNIAAEIHEKYPNIDESYIKQGLGGIRPGFASGKKKSVKVVSSDESKNVEETAKETEPKDEPKKTRETKSQFKRELPAGSAMTVKENIGTFTKAGDDKVEMPATKEVAELFDSLNKAASKEENRHFMTDAYYDGENFVSTDGRRLVCIKAGDIGLDKGYVKVDTNGGKITVTALPEKKDYEFPNYKRVMPGSANTQEVKFDNKALKEKLKEMKKDGAFNKNSYGVDIEFKDGKAYLDGTVVGSGDVKFPEGQEPFIKLNGFYLMDAALAGDSSSMFLDKDKPANRAADISTNNSDIVIMTMEPVRSDYESGRKAKADKKAAKDKAKAENRKNNEKLLANFEPTKVDRNVENVASDIDSKLSEFSDDDLKENYDRLTIDFDKVMEKPGLMSLYSKVNKNGLSFGNAYLYSQLAKKHPEIKEKFEAEMKKRGLEVKKSIFDGFLVAELLEEDVDDVEEDKEEECLWNDYSAEQPELFNSTELMVREALNRRRCL